MEGIDKLIAIAIAVASRDRPHVANALAALMADRPGLAIRPVADGVVVSGDGSDRFARAWWTTALLNERLFADAAERRAQLLADFVA